MDPNLPQQSNTPPPPTQPVAPAPVADPYYQQPPKSNPFKKLLVIGIIVIIILAIVGAIAFAITRVQSSTSSKNVTLKYWGLWDDSAIIQPIISDFERTHPNIKVQYEKQDIKGLGQYVERLTTRINNVSGPDIIRFHSSWTLQLKNYLLPFPKPVVDATQLENDFYKTVERDMKIGGAYYGIPLGVDTLSMFVNTKLLQEKGLPMPQYWNEIYEKYAPELVVKDQSGKIITPSIALGTYDNITHAPDIIAMLLLQNGADLSDLTAGEGENAKGALDYYTVFSKGEKAV